MERTTNSTLSSDMESEEKDMSSVLISFSRWMDMLWGSFLIVTGIPGNVLTIMVFYKRPVRVRMISTLLVWLSVVNLTVITNNVARRVVIGVTSRDIRTFNFAICVIHKGVSYVNIFVVSWLLVLIQAIRLAYIIHPRRTTAAFPPWTIHLIVLCLVAVAVCLHQVSYHDVFSYAQGSKEMCTRKLKVNWQLTRAVLMCYVPGSLILLMSSGMGVVFRKQAASLGMHRRNRRSAVHLTVMMVATTVQFIVCFLPYAIYFPIQESVFTSKSPMISEMDRDAIGNLVLLCMYTNCALNILVYCCFGSRFRDDLRGTLNDTCGDCCRKLCSLDLSCLVAGLPSRSVSSLRKNRAETGDSDFTKTISLTTILSQQQVTSNTRLPGPAAGDPPKIRQTGSVDPDLDKPVTEPVLKNQDCDAATQQPLS